MLKAIIVDDENGARQSLANILTAKCSNVEVKATADSVSKAMTAIKDIKPDIVFLDIQLHNETGFDLLEKIGNPGFEVIFTTAYDKYAIRAIKFAAVDYLLKPIDTNELLAAVKKAEAKRTLAERNDHIRVLLNNRKTESAGQTIGLPTMDGFDFVIINDIIRIESTGNYSTFFFANKTSIVASRLLKEFEELLSDSNFFRVHQSHLVNLKHIRKYLKGDGGELMMIDDSMVPVSKRKKADLLNILRIP